MENSVILTAKNPKITRNTKGWEAARDFAADQRGLSGLKDEEGVRPGMES